MEIAAVFGLGNPGPEYARSRHNIGFRVVDELARRWRAGEFAHRYRALIARRGGGRPLLLVKPQTFMNLSGDALRLLCDGESLVPDQCLVVVDDVELPLGQLRLRQAGGAGTHNGLRSLVERVGENFPRLRIGVAGESPWRDLAEYVLAPFEPSEAEVVEESVVRAADCVEMALHAGLARAATRFNRSAAPTPEE